jgi:hypothetical protein
MKHHGVVVLLKGKSRRGHHKNRLAALHLFLAEATIFSILQRRSKITPVRCRPTDIFVALPLRFWTPRCSSYSFTARTNQLVKMLLQYTKQMLFYFTSLYNHHIEKWFCIGYVIWYVYIAMYKPFIWNSKVRFGLHVKYGLYLININRN